MWTDVAARGGNVRRPPPGGMGSSERQGTLGGGAAGQESRGPIAVAVPSSQLWAQAFPSKAGPGCPSTARPLRTASRESRGRPTEGRHGRGAVTGSSHAFTPSLTHSFILPSGKHFPSTHAVWKGVGSRAGSSCVSGSKQCLGRGQGSHGEEDGREFRFDGETTLSCGPPLGRSVPSTWALSVVAPGSAGPAEAGRSRGWNFLSCRLGRSPGRCGCQQAEALFSI